MPVDIAVHADATKGRPGHVQICPTLVQLRSGLRFQLPKRAPEMFGAYPARSTTHGFTLIEILVVVVIVAVLAAALTLSVGGTTARHLDRAGDRFHALLDQACREAQLAGMEIGLVVAADSYTFSRLDGDQWHPFDNDSELRPRHWPDGLHVELDRDGLPLDLATAASPRPQVVCFSSGELTPFSLTLRLGDAPARRIRGAADGTLKIDPVVTPP